MTDNELISALRCCVSSPKIDKCKAECAFYSGGDLGNCIPRMGAIVADRLEALIAENTELKRNIALLLSEKSDMGKEIGKLLCEKSNLDREIGRLEAERDHFREVTKKLWCEKRYVGEDMNVPAIADHIRAMSDFELMEFLWRFNCESFENVLPFCKNTTECGEKLDSNDIFTEMCKRCLLEKLQQPYESPTGQKG